MLIAAIQNPGDDGIIRRASRMSNTIPGISRFPQGVLLAQSRIEGVILKSLADCSNVEVQRNVEPTSMVYHGAESQSTYPVTVKIAQVGGEKYSYPVSKPIGNGVVETNGQSETKKLNGLDKKPAMEKLVRAKYVIGCDGAHSWTRDQLGFRMEGEQSEYIWGVLGKSSRSIKEQEGQMTRADYG